ncbi:MAG TPA: transglycosylase SLT domain-containing protein [Polyangiaceae bacterium]|nr:transglycosylase SLT domain-containing protein [Polyangiaceae bacterium]
MSRTIAILAVASAGCSEAAGVGAPPAHSTAESSGLEPAAVAASSASSASSAPPAPAPSPTWASAVRLERYGEAKALLDALDPAEKDKPEIRFVRARVAIELKQWAEVGPLLEGVTMPLFEEDIARMRAEAAAEVGPFAVAAAFFEREGKPRDLVRAARALAKTDDKKGALKLADRALKEAERLRRQSDQRAAHAARADILDALGKHAEAIGDLKWLVTQAPETTDGRAARKALEPDKKALTDKDKRAVIDGLLEAGAGKEALELLESWGSAYSAAERAHKRAEALYKSRAYTKAAEAFLAASRLQSGRTAEQLYYAGRALARSKKEADAEKKLADVVKRFKKEVWADRASYQLAMLLSSRGDYARAADAFKSYLANFPKGESRDDAAYALALAYLGGGKPAEARKVLGTMAQKAKKTDWGVLRELEGVAALRAGQTSDAAAIFTDVAKAQPLTWAAQVSRARLVKMGAPLPPIVEPPPVKTSEPLRVVLPAKAAELAMLGLDEDAEAHVADNESLASAAYAGRETEALCAVYGKLSRAKRRYKVGSAATSFDQLMRAPSQADRWMWECTYPAPYKDRVDEAETSLEIPRGLVHSLMRQESAFDPEARSPVGAEGLLQLMPTTAAEIAKESKIDGFDPALVRSPDTNIQLGSFYIKKLLGTFQGSVPLAVASYNAGPAAVGRWVDGAKDREIDVFVARIPYEETRNYVVRVLGNLARYEWLAGGDAAVLSIDLDLPTSVAVGDDDY